MMATSEKVNRIFELNIAWLGSQRLVVMFCDNNWFERNERVITNSPSFGPEHWAEHVSGFAIGSVPWWPMLWINKLWWEKATTAQRAGTIAHEAYHLMGIIAKNLSAQKFDYGSEWEARFIEELVGVLFDLCDYNARDWPSAYGNFIYFTPRYSYASHKTFMATLRSRFKKSHLY